MPQLAQLHSGAHRETPMLPRFVVPSTSFGKGRRCSTPGCRTILNMYHRGPECYACEGIMERDCSMDELMRQAA